MTDTNTSTNDLHTALGNPLFEAVDQVGNLLSISKKSGSQSAQITKELHDYETSIIKKRGSTPHR